MTTLSMGGTSPAKKKEPKKEEPKPKVSKAPKPIHPGLDVATHRNQGWCRKCGTPIEFRETWGNTMMLGVCLCGLWIKNEREEVRLIRFDTDKYLVGEGPLFYQKKV